MASNIINKADKLLDYKKSGNLVSQWTQRNVQSRLNSDYDIKYEPNQYSELLASIYQGAGYKLNNDLQNKSIDLYRKSYDLWKVIWYSERKESVINYLNQLFHVVATGVMSESYTEIRMLLMEIELERLYEEIIELKWLEYLELSIYLLTLILIRKRGGWDDIKQFDDIIKDIEIKQRDKEESFYSSLDEEEIYKSLCYSAALLNLLEALEAYKSFVLQGRPENIEKVIMRYSRDSLELLKQSNSDESRFSLMLFEVLLIKLSGLTVWATVGGISEKVDEYIKLMTLESNDKPIFELWPSQQKAIERNLFDNTKTAIVVQMPTSAGKTLLAKFYILQTMNLYSNAKVAYIVPTRALVNQVKRDLRNDFKNLDIKVDVSIPYNDIEDIEDRLLLNNTDIIITTPEKLDILSRMNHPIIKELKLLVVDEAHGIQAENRGAKLELLLAMLRKENRNLRVLLLSPFMKNAESISKWLGATRGHDIYVDWKPSQQFTGAYKLESMGIGNHIGKVNYIPSSLNSMYNENFSVEIHRCSNKSISKVKKAVEVAKVYENLGGVLILCITKKNAENAAKEFLIKNDLPKDKLEELDSLLTLVEFELGKDSLLYKCIRKGCAFHHSSLPLIIREEIEEAICKQLINIVTSTTTLAQGMNFPISTVIFQGMTMPSNGYSRKMMPSEFWNIAGRAGRAMVDKEGHIISICDNDAQINDFKSYLSSKNQEVISSLVKVIKELPEDEFSRYHIRQHKELSALLQYIYHILLVDPEIEIDDLLRGSLVYYQLDESKNNHLGEKLIKLTRNYINRLDGDKKRKKLMESIDKSGLSSVSMHYLMSAITKNKIVIDGQKLFDINDNSLSQLIDLVKEIPEINLGLYNSSGRFNAELVAKITKSWVGGDSIKEIAEKHITSNENVNTLDEKIRVCGEYIYGKLINNLPWGLSAIQRANGIVNQEDLEDNLIPALIYFGVETKEAVAFSMLGMPRFFSQKVGDYWKNNQGEINIEDLDKITSWLNSLNKSKWNECFKDEDTRLRNLAYTIWKKQ